MEHEVNEYFDLPTLLKKDELGIRRAAATEPFLSAREYFGRLDKFLEHAPDVENALDRLSSLDFDREVYKSLDAMIAVLTRMKWKQFILDFHGLLDDYGKKGNWRTAAEKARRIAVDFKSLHSLVRSAKRTRKEEKIPEVTLSLEQFIRHLDEAESRRKLVILAVDDSLGILKTVASVLGDEYQVFTLSKPQALAKALENVTPDLFLLDYHMPEINGFELVPIIRAFEEHKDTPIIYLTSSGTIDTITTALGLGASDFAVKPFNPETLREKIARHIVRKKNF